MAASRPRCCHEPPRRGRMLWCRGGHRCSQRHSVLADEMVRLARFFYAFQQSRAGRPHYLRTLEQQMFRALGEEHGR